MEADGRTSFVTRLTERGLALHSFDGRLLKLTYNPAADLQIEQGKTIGRDELAEYARRILVELPEAAKMFPGLERIEIEFGEI